MLRVTLVLALVDLGDRVGHVDVEGEEDLADDVDQVSVYYHLCYRVSWILVWNSELYVKKIFGAGLLIIGNVCRDLVLKI